MIVATFLGGPHDGETWALPSCWSYVSIPIPNTTPVTFAADDPMAALAYRTIEIRPELTLSGWVLRWREPT